MESKFPDIPLRMRDNNLKLCIIGMLEDTFSLGAPRLATSGKQLHIDIAQTVSCPGSSHVANDFPHGFLNLTLSLVVLLV